MDGAMLTALRSIADAFRIKHRLPPADQYFSLLAASLINTKTGLVAFFVDAAGRLVSATGVSVTAPRVVAIPFASTVTVNTDVTDLANLATMTGAQTIAFGGTPTDGQRVFTHHQQDATGGRVLSLDPATAYFGTIGVTAANLPTAANSEWDMVWMYVASVGKWKAVGIA